MKHTILSKRSTNRTGDHSSLRLPVRGVRGGRYTLSRSPFALPPNAHHPAVALPVEILHTIFVFCAGLDDEDPNGRYMDTFDVIPYSATRYPRYPPDWISITYVCQRWRAVSLNFKKLWSTITPGLSPRWITAFLQRSACVPKHVDIDAGPPSPPLSSSSSSSTKPHKRRRFGMNTSTMTTTTTTKKKKRLLSSSSSPPVWKPPLMALPGEAVEELFSHASRIEGLHLEGTTIDVVRALASLGGPMPLLSCLCLGTHDEFEYPHFDSGIGDGREDPSLVLSETLFGASAPRLRRLHFRSGLHLTLPSWVFRDLTEFSVSCSFCVKRLFSALSQMPRLEVLRVSPARQYSSLPHSDEITMPVTLKHLSVLVFEDSYLELLIALLSCISMPPTVRRHLKLKLHGSHSDEILWDRFASMMPEIVANSPDPVHGIHFRREPSRTSVWLWASPASSWATGHRGSDNDHPSPSASRPPLDDPFSLEIHCVDHNCLYCLHTSYSFSFFHRLQELCVSLGGPSTQELFVEYGSERNSSLRPSIPQRCWRTLFAGLSSLKTLRLGDGAAELLVGALNGAAAALPTSTTTTTTTTTTTATTPTNSSNNGARESAAAWRGILSGSLQRVIVTRSAFSTRILWNWIHYAYAGPAEWDASDLRMNVLADLSVPRWRPMDAEPMEDVTESLLLLLLQCRSMGAQVSEVSLVESTWDEPGGLEILGRLLHILDPDWNVILEATSSPDPDLESTASF